MHGCRGWLLGCVLAVASWTGGCATAGQPCQRQLSDCLKRCEATTPDRGPALTSNPPYSTLSYCETRCGNCRATTPPPAKPKGKPTPTGTAQ